MVKLTAEFLEEDIEDALIDWLSREELINFIKRVDRRIADYDFTKELRDYFISEVEGEDAAYESEISS